MKQDVNIVILSGNLTAEPEKKIVGKTSVVNFALAVVLAKTPREEAAAFSSYRPEVGPLSGLKRSSAWRSRPSGQASDV